MSKSSELDKTVKFYILSTVTGDGYDVEPVTVDEKIHFVESCFYKEYGFAVSRYGLQGAVKEWLQGLPSAVNIEFMNYKIIQLAIEWGSLPADYTEKQADNILENYWNFMAAKLLQLFNGYRVPKN
jgi:hypothetical protein